MMKEQSSLSYLYGTNVPYIEDLYEAYLSSPDSVDSQWRQYFDQVAAMPGNTPKDVAHRPIQEAFANLAQQRGGAAAGGVGFALRVLENHNGVAIRASSDALVVFRIGHCLHGFAVGGGAY